MSERAITNGRLSEVWLNTGADGAGSPVLRKVAMPFRPGIAIRVMSERLNRRLEIDEAQRPTQIEIDAGPLAAATRSSRGRALSVGDRVSVQRRGGAGAARGPAGAVFEHFEVVSIDGADHGRPGGIDRVTIGLKAAVAPAGSLAASNPGGGS